MHLGNYIRRSYVYTVAVAIMSILRVSEVDFSKITFSAAKVQESGNRTIYINHAGEKLLVQLPAMPCPYGISTWKSTAGKAGGDKHQIDLSLKGYDEDGATKDCYTMLSKLDDLMIDTCIINSTTWLKKKISDKEVAKAIYTQVIKWSKDKDTGAISTRYPPIVRLTLPKKNDKVSCDIYDNLRNKLEFDSIDFKGATVTAIVHIANIWVANGKFGVTLKLQQMKVVPKPKLLGYAFVEDDD
jgi:hypothetical protein